MTRISLEDAQTRLPELIAMLHPGEEMQITQGEQPVARLVGEPLKRRRPRVPGSAIGQFIIMSEDEVHL